MPRRRLPARSVVLAAIVATLLTALAARADSTPGAAPETPPAPGVGRIEGRVTDASGRPLEFANVALLGTRIGTATDENGRFVLSGVPTGDQRLQIQAYGQPKVVRAVLVDAGRTARVDVVLADKVVNLEEFVVRGAPPIQRDKTETSHKMDRRQVQEGLVDDPVKAGILQAGVVARGEQISVHGGRPDEFQVRIEGVPSSDPATSRNASIATLAVEGLTLHTGGFDAETGGALSGILDITTREGADTLAGQVRWDTDRFGDPTKTFDRFDRVTFGVGGPTPIRRLTYQLTYEGTFSDTYLASGRTEPRRQVLDFVTLGNRQFNRIDTDVKLAYRPSPRHKLTLESIQNRTVRTPYEHMWSRRGWVHLTWDTTRVAGEPAQVTPRYGRWSATREDEHDVFVNLADHVPTDDDRYRQITGVWTNQISDRTAWVTRISTRAFRSLSAVGGKEPWEYWVQSPFFWSGNVDAGSENNPYYATHGDFPRYARRRSDSVTLKSDLSTARWARHRAKAGFEASYHRVENLALTQPNVEVNGLPGGSRSAFLNFHPEGSAYVQDRWEFEGLVLNAGLRYDGFTPGDQIGDAELPSGRRFKQQLSPRLGVAYPISDRDALSFFYGWTYQTPSRTFVFENRGLGANVNVRGNPDLQPETDVQYQAALQHVFSRDVTGQFSVFFRDIFGLITTRQERDAFGNLVRFFQNGDYASARGLEASVSKRFTHRFSADLHYTLSLANGVASDPNSALQFLNGGRLFLPISERPLAWDQRHTVTFSSTVRDPGRWGFRMLWTYGSGLPFTPSFRNDRRADPRLENSRRLPSSYTLNLDGDKFYRIWGRDVTLFVDARNVLNAVNIADLTPNGGGFPNPFLNLASGDDYLIYYSETGRAGGAYLQDVNGDNVPDWVPVHDPRVFEEGRNVRMGVSIAF